MEPDIEEPVQTRRRRWGGQHALFDDDKAIQLLLEAAGRCIARRGTARIAMAEVAEEASVTRSTLYRYFPTRTDLISALLLSRAEALVSAAVASLPDPGDAASSVAALIMHPVEKVSGSPITYALFSPESEGLAVSVEFESDAIFELAHRHYEPLLTAWQADGQLHADLDLATTTRWIMGVSVLLVSPPLRELSTAERRKVVDQYVVRALIRR